jgi:hypothetical protein
MMNGLATIANRVNGKVLFMIQILPETCPFSIIFDSSFAFNCDDSTKTRARQKVNRIK